MNETAERPFDKNVELLRAYRAGDREAGEELVRLNRPLVYSIAARFSGRGADRADLLECGDVGLVKAINTFDFSRECAFSTYAVPLILGEIRRFLRDDGIIKVSREEKRLCAMLNAERERRLSSGEDCRVAALAAACGVPPEDAAEALFAGVGVRSLDEAAYEDDDCVPLSALIADEDANEREFDKLALRLAMEKLPPLWQKILALRYFRDLSQVECARQLGLTQVKISREEKKILAALREELSPEHA